jgi:hypothetical protein
MVLVAIFLVTVGRHVSPQDPQVTNWFDEYFRMWGVSYDELTGNHLRASWCTIGTLVPTYPRAFRGSGDVNQIRPDFDSDMDFGVPGNSERRLTSSDTSSNGQSVAPTDTRKIVDGSASRISTDQYFIHHDSQPLRDFAGSSGPPGRLTKGILPDIRLMREEEAMAINSVLHSSSSSRDRSHTVEGGFVSERMMREHLPALVTTGQSPMGLNNHGLYARMANSSCTGVSEESDSQSAIDSPSLARTSPRSGPSPATNMDTHPDHRS